MLFLYKDEDISRFSNLHQCNQNFITLSLIASLSTRDNNQRYFPNMCIITYLIKSFLKKHSIKNDQKFSVRISHTGNSYVPPNINVFQQNFVTYSKMVGLLDQTLWHVTSRDCENAQILHSQAFLIKDTVKSISDKISLANSCLIY